MSEFNKSYRIRTEVGKDTQLHVKLDQKYDVLEIMSLKIDQENAYRLHTSNYGVIAGRVLANGSFGIPNAKISVFINIDDNDINDPVKAALYPYNTTSSKNKDGVRYNLLPNEQVTDCHTIIGTFPEKQYTLDNDSILEVFEKYYKYTTRTNEAGDYMIFGVPVGSQTIHTDIDLSDIGILSQKPRDMVYKGYNINQFENPNKFKYDTNLNSLTQVISQDSVANVIPFWGDETEGMIGITRCDIDIQYKFEPTCVFMGSVVSDTASNGISKKCIPSPGMGAMDELTTGSGTIEMIRKKPDGSVEEFQIQGTQLINGDGVWCYQIPMNLDYMMTDEFGNMVPTNDPNKGIPTRTRVRFRISMQDFETDNANIFRCKMLVPHNPLNEKDIDYQFGTITNDDSYRDLFWNGVYSVKSYIPRIQKGSNWKNEKFTGFKRVNYYGDKNPIPYNNIRIRIPFMYMILCTLVKFFFKLSGWVNRFIRMFMKLTGDKRNAVVYTVLDGTICDDSLENVCIIPGIDIKSDSNRDERWSTGLVVRTIINFVNDIDGDVSVDTFGEKIIDKKSIDSNNALDENDKFTSSIKPKVWVGSAQGKDAIAFSGITVTNSIDYLIQCVEMNLAEEFKVIQFDFYNDWINGLIYIPRWMRNITKKRTFIFPKWTIGGKIKACNENFNANSNKKRNIVQQCGLSYNLTNNSVNNNIGCHKKKNNCHKNKDVRLTYPIFKTGGIVKSVQNLKQQYIYYFKPCEEIDGKMVKLFSTDIILLGSLNNCDKWGIPNNLKEMVSSSFQIPTNLALTDSDIEGRDYKSNTSTYGYGRNYSGGDIYGSSIFDDGEALKYLEWGGVYNSIGIKDDDGNYTELSGIDWGYNGPLQMVNTKTDNKLYTPGGHFLGLSCRNSETTIKTCINLTRICEYGVWMSQRQELNIPSNASSVNEDNAFLEYATVPSGFISKDEINDSDYRRIFATLNSNRLKTVIDNKTGYPIYDFLYLHPTNFGGELSNHIRDNKNYNRFVSDSVHEKYYTYTDDDNQVRGTEFTYTVNEKQIVRTGEFTDTEYLKYRFGLTEDQFNTISTRKSKYLINGTSKVSFPMYENSFYFYFGLHDGRTALDEFKKQYYAICEKNNISNEKNDSITINSLNVTFDGVCEDDPKGSIEFFIDASKETFGDDGLSISLYDDKKELVLSKNATYNDNKVKFTKLKAGLYNVTIISNVTNNKVDYPIEVERVNISSIVSAVDFKMDVSDKNTDTKFILDRHEYGGYISFKDNIFTYYKGVEVSDVNDDTSSDIENADVSIVEENVFTSAYIKQIMIKGKTTGVIIKNRSNNLYEFTYNDIVNNIELSVNSNKENMIPVPFENETYSVYVTTYIGNKCKPYNLAIIKSNEATWYIGDVTVNNGIPLNILYQDMSFENDLKFIVNSNQESWWDVNNGGVNWDIFDKRISWKLKEGLYMNNLQIPHTVKIRNTGGAAPYTEIVTGMKDDAITTEGITRADFETVNVPTINYIKNENKRDNFTYQVKDVNDQVYPETPFIFPVIYKPFFMEMGVWYFDKNKKYYLIGNVYNGKTWDYETEGFNDVKLNNVPIANFATITHDDTTMSLNEIDNEGNAITGGGYNYTGPYFKYNGRKTVVSREIEPITYGLHNHGIINSFNLTVGCKHEEEDLNYSDNTNATRGAMEFFTFTMTGTTIDDKYCVSMSVNLNNSNNTKYTTIALFDDETNGYKYPLLGDTPNISPKLQYALMNNDIKPSNLGNLVIGDGYIDINAVSKNEKSLYYIALPDNTVELTNTSHPENKVKAISVSNLIDLNNLSNFYPLEIVATANDVLQSDGTYKTTMTIKPRTTSQDTNINERIVENFKNKKIVFTFYNGNIDIIMQTITIVTGNDTSVIFDITGYRSILGLKGNSTNLMFYFDVYSGEQKSPTSYLNIGSKPYTMAVTFIDNTLKEETPPAE